MTTPSEQGAAPANIVNTAPDHIWLDIAHPHLIDPDETFRDLGEVTWSEDNATGCGIKYVRASLPSSEGAGWIGVDERLPAKDEPVLVFAPTGVMPITIDEWCDYHEAPVSWSSATIVTGEGWAQHDFEQITHWMPLPSAPGAAPVVEPVQVRDETPEQVFKRVLAEADACTPCLVTPADAVEFRREAYGFTQAQMAKVLGMQQSHYSEFVNGRRELPRSAIRRAAAIGVPSDALLGFPGAVPVVEPGAQAGREAEDAAECKCPLSGPDYCPRHAP